MYTLLELSSATPHVLHKLVVVGPAPLLHSPLVKLVWPKTLSAVVLVVSGVLYLSSRLFWLSETKTFPAESTATPSGPHRLSAVIPPLLHVPVVKLPSCPNTLSATPPLTNGVLNSSTRLLPLSAT